ncbi:Pollen Ole e 1 allergen/extensin [Corchorus capsularis]|uniref:Pollen Ole e 1 allergen/extensin n=1 Tax=Corchorus capsularis TaxID=210143 RepID=A0A1R3H0L6_COCAP|nr:Pollen Ole e 1 allergen/extensin [Corchorus capsularis]
MAPFRLSLAFSLLLLSLLVIASADDYSKFDDYSKYDSKYGFDGIPGDAPQAKPEEEETKPHYDTKPVDYNKSNSNSKPVGNDYGNNKPEVVKPKRQGEEKKPNNYGTKKSNYTPKPQGKYEEKEKPYVVKPEKEEKPGYGGEKKPYYNQKPNYGSKPDNYKPKPEGENKPNYYKPKPEGEKKPNYGAKPDNYNAKPEEKENVYPIAVQGLVLCKSGSKYYPIQGALATITCKTVDKDGVEKTVSVCSGSTDQKGYFLAKLSNYGLAKKLKLKDCNTYLHSSPLETCNVPTNVNKGIVGAPLPTNFHILKDKKINLYSVGPFFYAPKPQSAPTGY